MKLSYDLHIHTALSPCGDVDNTPNNIVNMAALKGLDVIAVTDHNSILNCRPAIVLGERAGLIVLPGMELTTSEDIHILCLFPDLDCAEKYYAKVDKCRVVVPNREEIFGRQQILDETDAECGVENRLLTVATTIGVDQAGSLCAECGGIAVPAHIDKESNSLVSILGALSPDMGYPVVELSPRCTVAVRHYYASQGYGILTNSDAHLLELISEPEHFLECSERSAQGVFQALKKLGETAK